MIVYFFKKSKRAKAVLFIVFTVLILIYVCFILGRLHQSNQFTIQIIRKEVISTSFEEPTLEAKEGNIFNPQFPFVASKRGIYYYPVNCSKAKALSIKNMLYFKGKMEAEVVGYKPHSGC